jgi:hypothetical protein
MRLFIINKNNTVFVRIGREKCEFLNIIKISMGYSE